VTSQSGGRGPVAVYGAHVGDDVRLGYRKFNGDLHWHTTLRRLGTDEYGTRLGAPAGTVWQRVEPPEPFPSAHVVLIPVNRWWTAVFNAPPAANPVSMSVRRDAHHATNPPGHQVAPDRDTIQEPPRMRSMRPEPRANDVPDDSL
jgi:hypothetical protein